MRKKLWIATFTVASLVGLVTLSPIARGQSRNMNQENSNVQPTSRSVEQTNTNQTQQEVVDYWTPERMRNAKPAMPTISDAPDSRNYWTPDQMRNAKPAMPTVPETPSSGDEGASGQGGNAKPATPTVSDTPDSRDYWTPERMRNAKPAMPTRPDAP